MVLRSTSERSSVARSFGLVDLTYGLFSMAMVIYYYINKIKTIHLSLVIILVYFILLMVGSWLFIIVILVARSLDQLPNGRA